MSGRIRVAHVITQLDVGGAQETLLSLARNLDRASFEISVGAGIGPSGAGVTADELRAEGVDVTVFRSLRRSVSLGDVVTLLALVRWMRRTRPDVVHTHSSKAGVLGRVAAWIARVPTVHTVHGWSFHEGQPRWAYRVCVAIERLLARITDTLVVVAASDQVLGEAARIRPRRGYTLIRSGIDLDRFAQFSYVTRSCARRALGLDDCVPVVGTVMRLAPQKDPITWVRAFAAAHGTRPNLHGVIVGDGPLRAAVESEAVRLGVRDAIVFAGERRDVARLLPAFDVFMLSSRWEGLPRVVIEAMASGVPVVSTDVNGVREVVADGVSGLLVSPGDADALAVGVAKVIDDKALAAHLRATAHQHLGSFGATAMARAHEHLYRILVAPRRTCRPQSMRHARPPMHVNYEFLLDFVRRNTGRRASARVLDYGCGRGEVVAAGRAEGIAIWGAEVFYEGGSTRATVEASPLLREVVKEIVDGVLPFEDETFDVVVSNQVLEHVEDLTAVISEIARVLRPGGRFLALYPSREVWREGHIRIPFAHRLPRNRLRREYTRALRTLGLGGFTEPCYSDGWASTPGAWADEALAWIDGYTHYRAQHEIEAVLKAHFDIAHAEHDYIVFRLGRGSARARAARRVPTPIARYALNRLAGQVVVATKRGAGTG